MHLPSPRQTRCLLVIALVLGTHISPCAAMKEKEPTEYEPYGHEVAQREPAENFLRPEAVKYIYRWLARCKLPKTEKAQQTYAPVPARLDYYQGMTEDVGPAAFYAFAATNPALYGWCPIPTPQLYYHRYPYYPPIPQPHPLQRYFRPYDPVEQERLARGLPLPSHTNDASAPRQFGYGR